MSLLNSAYELYKSNFDKINYTPFSSSNVDNSGKSNYISTNSNNNNDLDWLSIIEQNVSRQNRFDVNLFLPNLSELSSYADKNMNVYIQDASLPSQSLRLTETMYQGLESYAILAKNTDFTILKFYDTKELKFRNMFLAWHSAVIPINEHKSLKYFPNEYQGKIEITIHEKKYLLDACTPMTIGDFVLSHNMSNSLGTFDVTFKVKSCKPI